MAATEPRWRIPPKVPISKILVALILAAVGLAGEYWQTILMSLVALGVLGWAARDLLAPVRLAADPAGLTVTTGFARRHRLAWSQVERIRVDVRRRSRMLEVDVGDHLYLYSRFDLDADLDTVTETLRRLRSAAVN